MWPTRIGMVLSLEDIGEALAARASGMSGKQLRAVREKLGLTQVEMAEAVGLHVNSYAKAERGEMMISRTLAKLVMWIASTGKPHPPFVDLPRPRARPRKTRR